MQRCAQAVITESYNKIEAKKIKERAQIVVSTVFKEDLEKGDYEPINLPSS